jgi:hypothetical protein
MLLAEELVLPCGLTLPNRLCKVSMPHLPSLLQRIKLRIGGDG